MLWPDPAQQARLAEIRDNLTARIAKPNARAGTAKSNASRSASPEPNTSSPRSASDPAAQQTSESRQGAMHAATETGEPACGNKPHCR